MAGIYLLLGSNKGDKRQQLTVAINRIEKNIGMVCSKSSLYVTKAWGNTNQPDFLDQVVEIEYSGTAGHLLDAIRCIQEDMGRIRDKKWGPRVIDIDILFFHDLIFRSEKLIIPHPEIANRRFTLEPLVEIAPHFIHPLLNKSNQFLLDACSDTLEVKKIGEN